MHAAVRYLAIREPACFSWVAGLPIYSRFYHCRQNKRTVAAASDDVHGGKDRNGTEARLATAANSRIPCCAGCFIAEGSHVNIEDVRVDLFRVGTPRAGRRMGYVTVTAMRVGRISSKGGGASLLSRHGRGHAGGGAQQGDRHHMQKYIQTATYGVLLCIYMQYNVQKAFLTQTEYLESGSLFEAPLSEHILCAPCPEKPFTAASRPSGTVFAPGFAVCRSPGRRGSCVRDVPSRRDPQRVCAWAVKLASLASLPTLFARLLHRLSGRTFFTRPTRETSIKSKVSVFSRLSNELISCSRVQPL